MLHGLRQGKTIDVALRWHILVEHLLVSLHFMETWLPCPISHHQYACVVLECAGIHNKHRVLLLQVGFSITSSDTSFELTLSLLQKWANLIPLVFMHALLYTLSEMDFWQKETLIMSWWQRDNSSVKFGGGDYSLVNNVVGGDSIHWGGTLFTSE